MSELFIDPKFGRVAFGDDPGSYHVTRPGYPDWVFETLRERCHLAPGTATLRLAPDRSGNTPIARFRRETVARHRAGRTPRGLPPQPHPGHGSFGERIGVRGCRHRGGSFDLGVSATTFHLLNEDMALVKVAELLRPGGWWAMVWNVFGYNSRPDPFHEATKTLLNGPASPSAGSRDVPFALDAGARVAALERTGAFDATDIRRAPGRLSSILTKPSRSMRPFPISTFAPTARQSSRSWVASPATSSTAA